MKTRQLETRFFGGDEIATSAASIIGGGADDSSKRSHCEASHTADNDSELQLHVGEGLAFKEDTFLTSANLCRWVVDFNEISLGKQVQPTPQRITVL